MALSGPGGQVDGGVDGGDGDNFPNRLAVVCNSCSPRRQRSSELTSSLFDNLTEELLIEILKRLPLKPANLCKCVSKRWLSLISGSYFGRCYARYHHSTNSPPFAFYYQMTNSGFCSYTLSSTEINLTSQDPIFKSPGFSLSFLPRSQLQEQEVEPLHYLASDNGLILCSTSIFFQKFYFVCNPLTKKWVVLPPPPSCPRGVRIGFICNPYYSCFNDTQEQQNKPTITKFKVVRIEVLNCESPSRFSDTLKLEIFCSEKGQWTEEIFTLPDHKRDFCWWAHHRPNAVVSNGLLHWDTLWRHGFFAFDPYNTKYRTIELPEALRTTSYCFAECRGHLRYAHISWKCQVLQVYELKDDSCEWCLVHNVQVREMEFEDRHCNPSMVLLSVLWLHPIDDQTLYLRCPKHGHIVEFNVRNRILKAYSFLPHPKASFLISIVSPFVLPCWLTTVPVLQMEALDQ